MAIRASAEENARQLQERSAQEAARQDEASITLGADEEGKYTPCNRLIQSDIITNFDESAAFLAHPFRSPKSPIYLQRRVGQRPRVT